MTRDNDGLDQHLQVLDVHVVDVLSHLEALLRHSHSIQRALLQLRAEAPPPKPAPSRTVAADLTKHAKQMGSECEMLGEIIRDLAARIDVMCRPAVPEATEGARVTPARLAGG